MFFCFVLLHKSLLLASGWSKPLHYQALGEAALGGSGLAPNPEILYTSLCTACHVIQAGRDHLSTHSHLCLPYFLSAGLQFCLLPCSFPHFLQQFSPPNNYKEKH